MLRSLQRSTPFRLMAALGGTFLVFLVLAGIAAFGLIRAELDARMQRQLEQTFAVIAQSYGEDDITDLTDLVRSNSAANASDERVFLLRDAAGTALAGNIVTAPQTDGWSAVPPEALGLPAADAQYQIFSGPIGPNRLTVGASFAETGAIGTIVLNSLGLAAALFVMLLVVVGILIAARGQRRMDRIADTMALVGKGELSARIPLRGNHDDLDDLSIQINQALDRLAGLVEGMRQVSVDIAHDLKTPLNRLSFTVQQAIDNDEAGRPLAPLLQQVQDEARQINTTFEALLRIAQIESGARRARFKPLSLGPILENLFEAYEDVALEQGQSLHLALEPLPDIVGDRDLLTQMIANLIENAIRHCPPGTGITLSAARTSAQAFTVSVADTGTGIPQAEREKVFQRLYRLDKSRGTPGHGLGLSLVKAIAELHGASIASFDNQPGLRMEIIFPAPAAVE